MGMIRIAHDHLAYPLHWLYNITIYFIEDSCYET